MYLSSSDDGAGVDERDHLPVQGFDRGVEQRNLCPQRFAAVEHSVTLFDQLLKRVGVKEVQTVANAEPRSLADGGSLNRCHRVVTRVGSPNV